MADGDSIVGAGYESFLRDLTTRIRAAQTRAALAVNRELVLLYWELGRAILARQETQGWGAKVIARLSGDLRREFPELKGFSPRNLLYMRAFAAAYPDQSFVQEVLAQISWYHNITLLDKLADPNERHWYVSATIHNGWSRAILVHQIERDLYHRQGQAISNFARTLPAAQAALAQQLLKDPYTFDFLNLTDEAHERDLERGLLAHLRDFLLELGVGFAFVGSQYHLAVGDQDFYLDLLFYHLRLRCYVVIDLKIGDFKPEDAGKMNFYLAVADERLRHDGDQPSIGLILCKAKNRVIAEYALRGLQQPIGVSAYDLTRGLPDDWRGSLPTIEELEATLSARSEETDDPAS